MSQSYDASSMTQEEARMPLGFYFEALRRRWWLIGLVVALCIGAALTWSSMSPKMYESTTVIQLDSRAPAALIGQNAGFTSLADIDQFIATQIKLIQSERVLHPVLAKHPHLATITETGFGPVVHAQTELKGLKVNRPPNTLLFQVSYEASDPELAATVANEIAASYLEQAKQDREKARNQSSEFLEKQAEDLRGKIQESTESMARMAREMELINPEQRTSLLSARLNDLAAQLSNAQAERMLKEAAANQVRNGSLEALQASPAADALRPASDHLTEAKLKMADAAARFGPNFPDYKRAQAQLAEAQTEFDLSRQIAASRVQSEYKQAQGRETMLQAELQRTKAEFDRVNARAFDYDDRKKQAEADQKLYDDLLRKAREITINGSYDPGYLKVAEAAVPASAPSSPNKPLNAAIGLLIGIVLAGGGGILSELLDSSVRDPEQVGRAFGAEVLGVVPMITGLRSVGGFRRASQKGLPPEFSEAVRVLRSTLLDHKLKPVVKSMLLTSAAPGEGKSTLAASIAMANANHGLKTLLVDADLNRGRLHHYLPVSQEPGLAEILSGQTTWKDAVMPVPGWDGLFAIACGKEPAAAPGKDRSQVLAEMLKEVAKEYELIILDGPPLPGSADAMELALVAEGVLVVAKSGSTDRRALGVVMSTLDRLNARVLGVVLNQTRDRVSALYYPKPKLGPRVVPQEASTVA